MEDEMDLTTALTRATAYLDRLDRLREKATPGKWAQAGKYGACIAAEFSAYTHLQAARPTTFGIADCAHVAAAASPDAAAQHVAAMRASGDAMLLLAQWRLSLAQDHGCYGSPTCRQCGQLDAVDAEVARYLAWCESLPGSVVPGVEDGE